MVCQTCDTKNLDDALFCSNCGTQLRAIPQQVAPQTRRFNLPMPQPQKPGFRKTCLILAAALIALVVFCGGMAALVSGGEPQIVVAETGSTEIVTPDEPVDAAASTCEEALAADEVAAQIPEQQAAFIQTVEAFAHLYNQTENELQGSIHRAQRKEALATLLPDRAIQGWTGTLESLSTDTKGNAYITIRPDGMDSITIATWNNALRDVGTNSMIPSGSDLYNKLAGMNVGDRVVFSGAFAASDEDHLAESSMTEVGSMTTPGFVLVFEDVTPEE